MPLRNAGAGPTLPARYGWLGRHPRPAPAGTPAAPVVRPRSVPVTGIILAQDERLTIERAVRSLDWCTQVVVVDSGSTDGTQDIARSAGATVWEERWRGFAGQREWAMRQPQIEHDWVFFLDADEWIPADLAAEIACRVGTEDCAAYTQRRRLVFLGRWIAHCGWYTNSWQARLLDRRFSSFAQADEYGERAEVRGRVLRLSGAIVDEDAKGLANWLRRHVGYAELEAWGRSTSAAPLVQIRAALSRNSTSTRPLTRTLAKDVVFPLLPAKPVMKFVYMYFLRAGWRDGRAGLLFCIYHAWHELNIGVLLRAIRAGQPPPETATSAPTTKAGVEIFRIPQQFTHVAELTVLADSRTVRP